MKSINYKGRVTQKNTRVYIRSSSPPQKKYKINTVDVLDDSENTARNERESLIRAVDDFGTGIQAVHGC